ncbi:MAG: M42 family metallopeptidase [Anaerolineales bacterium]
MKAQIKKYVEAYGPSGFEDSIREMIRAEIRGLPDYITVDGIGNLIGVIKKQSKSGKKVLLIAHMDEIGVIVTHVDERGFCRFLPLGGVSPLTCVGGRVRFENGAMGVIGLEKRDNTASVPSFEQLFIDVGATSRDDCPVQVGAAAGFYRPMDEVGSRLTAKSMDDRIGCVVLLQVLKALKRTPHEVAFVWSVQEEVGTRGAGPAAYGFDPDVAVAVDVTLTGDTPKGLKMDVALGAGPAIKIRDSGMLADPRVVRLLREAAEAAKLPYQMEILERGTTDARPIQVTRLGVPAGVVSIPCRHIHTPSEMVDVNDVNGAIELLLSFLKRPIEL